MSSPSEPLEGSGPSPVERGGTVAQRWSVGTRYAVRGDLHLHAAAGEVPARMAVWRYRGSEPLPRFMAALEADRGQWPMVRNDHVVATLDLGRITGQTNCYWVQQEAAGVLLSERLDAHPMFAPDVALAVACGVGAGLVAIHRADLVHGDLDPGNVVISGARERARLAWGGLATRVELAGMDAGRGEARSLSEVAPEVLQGAAPTPESDVYALGSLLYRMLAGQPAWLVRRKGPIPGLGSGDTLPPLPIHVTPELAALLATLLQREPARRPSSLGDLVRQLADLEARSRGLQVPLGAWAPPATSQEATPPTVSRSIAPAARRDHDGALANTPVSMSRRGAPPAVPGFRSLVPESAQLPQATPARSHTDRSVGERTTVPAPPPSPSLALPAAVLAGAVVLGTLLLAAAWVTGRSPGSNVVPVPVPMVTIAAPAPGVSGPAVLTLRTDPPGAEVFEGGQPIGTTPVEIVMTGGPADPPREIELRLTGYATHTVRQPWSSASVQHTVPLQKVAAQPPRPVPGLQIKEER